MNFFSDTVARLKHELRVSKDGEVAVALGLSKTAFAERKRRGAFPEKELHALAMQRPDLGLDVHYILTGERIARFAEMGERLSGERRRLGMSTQYMAEAGGVTVEQQKSFERGQTQPPAEYLNRLVPHDVETHWILFGSEELDAVRDKKPPPYTPDVRNLIADYQLCSGEIKGVIKRIAKDGADRYRKAVADFKEKHGGSVVKVDMDAPEPDNPPNS